jgi:signal transduction histidine kinase
MNALNYFKSLYFSFFNWCLSPSERYDKVHKFRVHSLIAVTFITGILMWSYAFTAYTYINHPSIKYTGFVYALIHLMAPLVYKFSGSIERALYVTLIPGGSFQVHYALLTLGFLSPLLVWIAILPVIAGVLTNMKHTIIWTIIVCFTISIIAYLDLSVGLFKVNYLEGAGIGITQVLTSFGMIILHSGFTIFLLKLREISEEQLRSKAIAKQNLLRVIAHDVTNPITVIKNNLSFLNKHIGVRSEKEMFPKIKKKLIATEKSSNTIFNLISSVKEIEAFESGKKKLDLEKVSIKDCIDESLELLYPLIEKKNIRVRVLMDDDMIWGLKSVIEHQIISNILTNSIKFSEDNTEILIHSKKVDREVHLIVKDQGIGIPTYILNKVFDPLASTSRPGINGELGTGFGMPIAKRSVGLLGGQIQVTSRTISDHGEDHGTIFKVCFQNAEFNFNQSISA